jgi:tetratricopeptide (TPR) repeat protein
MRRSLLSLALFLIMGAAGTLAAQDAKLNALLNAVKANPKNASAHFNLAVEYYNRQQLESALPEFERAVKLNSKDKDAKEMAAVTKGILAFRNKEFDSAASSFRTALKVNPKSPDAIQYLPHSYMYLKEYDKAEKGYLAYLQAFPGDKETVRIANHNLSKLYIEQKRYPEAQGALKKLLAVDPKNFDAHKNLGFVLFSQKDYAGAASSLERSLKIKKDAQAYKILGFSYYNLGRFKDATSKYEASLKLDKSDPELYYNLAVAYYDNAQYDEAADAFGTAMTLNPEAPDAATFQAQAIEMAINGHMEKGSNLYLNNEYSRAIEEWQAVLKYQPGHKEAQAFLSDAKGKLKGEVRKHVRSGRELSRQGKNLEALRELNLALSMDPQNKDALTAVNQLKVKRSEKVGSYLEQGDDYLATKDYAAAIQKYRGALKVNPEDARVKTKLSRAKTLQKQEELQEGHPIVRGSPAAGPHQARGRGLPLPVPLPPAGPREGPAGRGDSAVCVGGEGQGPREVPGRRIPRTRQRDGQRGHPEDDRPAVQGQGPIREGEGHVL